MNRYIYTFILASLLFVSCEKELEFKGEVVEPMLVVNSVFLPDTNIEVSLTQSRFFLNSSNENYRKITDGDVDLYVNGGFKEKLVYKKKEVNNELDYSSYDDSYSEPDQMVYISDYKPKVNDELQLKASAPKLNSVYTNIIKVPYSVEVLSSNISNYRAQLNNFFWGDNDFFIPIEEKGTEMIDDGDEFANNSYYLKEEFNLQFDFQEEAKTNNYYILEIVSNKISSNGRQIYQKLNHKKKNFTDDGFGIDFNSFTIKNSVFAQNLDVEITIFEDEFYEMSDYFIFDDGLIDGDRFKFDLDITISNNVELSSEQKLLKNELIIILTHLSKEYFLYKKSLDAYLEESYSLFSEPIQVYTNINNGIGIFATKNSSKYIIDLPTYFEE